MSKYEIKILEAQEKGILSKKIELPDDKLDKLNYILDLLQSKYNLSIMIQSDVSFSRGENVWQCIIGRNMTDNECAHIFSNGIGKSIDDAMINSINEFIETYIRNKNYLLK